MSHFAVCVSAASYSPVSFPLASIFHLMSPPVGFSLVRYFQLISFQEEFSGEFSPAELFPGEVSSAALYSCELSSG